MAESKQKLNVAVATKDLILDRAAAEGVHPGEYLDRLVREDDLRIRMRADVRTMEAAGLTMDRTADRTRAALAALRGGQAAA